MQRNNKTIIPLVLWALGIAAFLLRIYLIPSHLFFGPEQGRDLLVVKKIVLDHKMTLIGAKTDIPGIFHGPVYYYLASIPFYFSHGNPVMISFFFIALSCVTLYLLYLLTLELTGKTRTALIASALFSVAYGCIVYPRWLANPPLTIPLAAGFFLSVVRFVKGRQWDLIWLAIYFALLGQVEFINFLIFGILGIGLTIRFSHQVARTKLPIILAGCTVAAVLSLGNYVLFDVRHEYLISKSLAGLIGGNSGVTVPFVMSLYGVLKVFGNAVAMETGLHDWRLGLGIVLFCTLVSWRVRREHTIFDAVYIWIFLPVILFILLRHVMLEHFIAALLPGIIILMSVALDRILTVQKTAGIILILLVFSGNILSVFINFPNNENVFFQNVEKEVLYKDEMLVIREIHKRSAGREFSFQAYTIPYFWQDGWTYLFWYEGSRRKLFIPYKENSKLLYVIIQKDRINPDYQKNWYQKTVSQWGTKKSEFRFGEFTVEELIVP